MSVSRVDSFCLKGGIPNVESCFDESSSSKVAEVALPLLRASSDPTEQEEPNTPDFDGVYTRHDLTMRDLPKENNAFRVICPPVIPNKDPSPPPTPRASTRTTPQPKFFDEDSSVVKEVIPDPSKEKVVAPSNEVQKTLSIRKRREAEGITETKPMTLEEFNEKMTQGRISRCIKLFKYGANKNAIKLMKTFTNEAKETLLEQLQVEVRDDFAVEVESIMLQGILCTSQAQKWALDRCLKLFQQEKQKEAMLWVVTLTQENKKKLSQDLIEEGNFGVATTIAMLMDQEGKKEMCSMLIQKKEYDFAMWLLSKFLYTHRFYFLEQCEKLIVDGRDDLAVNLSKAKLNDKSRYKLCNLLMDKCDPKIITQISAQMQDGADKQKIMNWLITKVVITV